MRVLIITFKSMFIKLNICLISPAALDPSCSWWSWWSWWWRWSHPMFPDDGWKIFSIPERQLFDCDCAPLCWWEYDLRCYGPPSYFCSSLLLDDDSESHCSAYLANWLFELWWPLILSTLSFIELMGFLFLGLSCEATSTALMKWTSAWEFISSWSLIDDSKE